MAAGTAAGATKISNQSGPWETSSTWSPSGAPSSTDDVIIAPSHVVEMGNTTVRVTYVVRSLEVRANGRLQRYNPGTTGTFQCGLRCTGTGPTGYSILNRGLIHNQVNSSTFIEANGPVHTDGSSITSRTSQQMGGFSWGWNNVSHAGQSWAHGHGGSDGDSTPGICLNLNGGTLPSPHVLTQAAGVNINSAPFNASLDALPRVYINGNYKLGSDLEFFSFESRIEAGGSLVLDGYRLMAQGPLHVGPDSGTQSGNSILRINDGTGTSNIGTWPQFRITAGPAVKLANGALIEIPTGSHGSAALGVAVAAYGSARINIHSEPTIPASLQNGAAPTFWIVGNLMLAGTTRVDIVVPGSPNNPTNSVLQVGQDLSFEDSAAAPPGPSAALITQSGNHGATGFPVVLVQSGAGGGNAYLPASDWHGTAGGTTPGTNTAGWTLTNSTLAHQGGVNVFDSFKFSSTGGNPGSAWGLHSVQVGLGSYQWGMSTVTITNQTNLSVGGTGTDWTLDSSALSVNGNRAAINGGGGNLFLSGGATFTQSKRPGNLPADGSIGVVDVNGNFQVTGGGVYRIATNNNAGEESTLRLLGQGTIPPSNVSGVPQLARQAPLGNVSIDDNGTLLSSNERNIVVFIGEKWHSSSVTLRIHPSKVTNLLHGRTVTFQASNGVAPYAYSLVSGSGSLSGATYTAPSSGTGTAIIRVTDTASPAQTVDAVVTYKGVNAGSATANLMISPGYENTTYPGYCYYMRGDLGSTFNLRAYGGTGNYTWSIVPASGAAGTLSGASGQSIRYTAAGGGTLAAPVFTVATVTLSDGGAGGSRTCYFYVYNFASYGTTYPIPFGCYHLRVGDLQTFSRPGASGTWTFTSNGSNATLNGGASATGTSVTLNPGSLGGTAPYTIYNYGTVTGGGLTGTFWFYTTALPTNNITISPTRFDGWLPGASYTFTGGGGNTPYTFSLFLNGAVSSITPGGAYTAGAGSSATDVVMLRDATGITDLCTVNKSVPPPPTGNGYVAVPGARTIFTNSSVNSVDQMVFADANDDFGTLQVLKTLSTGYRVFAASVEISPILLTMMNGTTQTFTASGGATPYTYSITTNNSGATINSSTGVYTAGATVNRADTVQVQDANGKIARATVNVVSAGGSAALEIRPRYIYHFYPGQSFQFRATGGVGGNSWQLSQNQSGGSVSGTGLYTAGPAGNFATDKILVADGAGDADVAWVLVWNLNPYVYPLWAWWDINTGLGKTRNGFDPGQTVLITAVGLGSPAWSYPTNNSGGTLNSSGATAIWTAGNTGNVTDSIRCASGPSSYTSLYKVQPPRILVSPAQASVFPGAILRFTSLGGTGTYTYTIQSNLSGASLTQSGSPAVGTYTAGGTAGTDIVRVADGVSWADVQVSVLSMVNPTFIRCSHADLFHGELDVHERSFRVQRLGATPSGQGDLISTNGGIAGATNPALRMGTGAQLTVDRAFVWNRFSNEFISGGTLTIGGSLKITDDTGGTSPQFDLQAPSGGTSTLVLTAANPDTATANTVDIWRATSSGGTPTAQNLYVVNLTLNDGGTGKTFNFLGPVCYSGTYSNVSGTISGITPQPNSTCGSP
ncbi:MAG: hypothetical protein L0216_20400, partial [Planctomycetales bacterium]|nr:hypothetical protein [Planctomycetales bacterium]